MISTNTFYKLKSAVLMWIIIKILRAWEYKRLLRLIALGTDYSLASWLWKHGVAANHDMQGAEISRLLVQF